jgi:hypothetical protein
MHRVKGEERECGNRCMRQAGSCTGKESGLGCSCRMRLEVRDDERAPYQWEGGWGW